MQVLQNNHFALGKYVLEKIRHSLSKILRGFSEGICFNYSLLYKNKLLETILGYNQFSKVMITCIWLTAQEHPQGLRIYHNDACNILRYNKAFGKLSDCTPISLSKRVILAFHIYFQCQRDSGF